VFDLQVLRRPHLVLPDSGTDNGVSPGDFVQAFDYIVRLNGFAFTVVIAHMILFQRAHMLDPG